MVRTNWSDTIMLFLIMSVRHRDTSIPEAKFNPLHQTEINFVIKNDVFKTVVFSIF